MIYVQNEKCAAGNIRERPCIITMRQMSIETKILSNQTNRLSLSSSLQLFSVEIESTVHALSIMLKRGHFMVSELVDRGVARDSDNFTMERVTFAMTCNRSQSRRQIGPKMRCKCLLRQKSQVPAQNYHQPRLDHSHTCGAYSNNTRESHDRF